MRQRRGIAATVGSLVICTLLVLTAATIVTYSDSSAQSSQLVQLETRETADGPIIMASLALTLAANFQSQVQEHPPTNCTSTGTVDRYLASIVVSNSTTGEDGGVTWQANGTATFYNGTIAGGQDNLTTLLTPAYAGYDKGMINLVAHVTVTEGNPSVSFAKSETHYIHLQGPLSDVCTSLDLLDGRMGMVVPLYADPDLSPQWALLVSAKIANPLVPVLAIIDPGDGPGSREDPGLLEGVQGLHQAGIAVLGYVDTGYGTVPLTQVEEEAAAYHEWYGVDGIFLDDMNASMADFAYYLNATQTVRALGMNYTMANPGAPTGDMGVANSIIEYENAGLPSSLPSTNSTVGTVIAYDVAGLPPVSWFESMRAAGVGWVWLTDQGDSYFDLPSYLTQEMSEIGSLSSPP